jgi:hypothetical protein
LVRRREPNPVLFQAPAEGDHPAVEFVKPQNLCDMAAREEPSSAGRLDADQRNAGISVSDCSYPDAGD